MFREPRLVVVDQSSDTADVLRAVFQPRGVSVERRRTASDPRSSTSGVYILDEDSVDLAATPGDPGWTSQPRVIIGSATLADRPSPQESNSDTYIAKPFEYAELIQAIEQLLEGDRGGKFEGRNSNDE